MNSDRGQNSKISHRQGRTLSVRSLSETKYVGTGYLNPCLSLFPTWKNGIHVVSTRPPRITLSLFFKTHGATFVIYFFITGDAEPIIQQLFGQLATLSLTAFAFAPVQSVMKSATSWRFPIVSNQQLSSMPLQGSTFPYGSMKKFSVPASQGSMRRPPLT